MKHKTITRAPFTGAPYGDAGKAAAPLTGTSMALVTTSTDPRLGAWFYDSQALTLQEGDTFTAAMHKIDRGTLAIDSNSGNGATLTVIAPGDATLLDIKTSGTTATIKALKAGSVSYTLTSGDGTAHAMIKITITAKAAPKSAQITAQPPAAVSLNEGDPISIKVTATGATAYRWEKLKADGKTWEPVNGKTSDTLAAAVAVPADTGSYHVVISGEQGSADVISGVCVLTVTAKPVDHLNLIESGSAPGTLTDYANGLQTLSIKQGGTFLITVQRISASTGAPVPSGGNGFKIPDAGNASIAEAVVAPFDSTNKRTLQISGKAPGTSTIKLSSGDGKALVTLTITVTA